jgi:hypothetical protein
MLESSGCCDVESKLCRTRNASRFSSSYINKRGRVHILLVARVALEGMALESTPGKAG